MPKIYAVHKGRVPGVYHTYAEAFQQINGYEGAEWKSFSSRNELIRYCIDFQWDTILAGFTKTDIDTAKNEFPYSYVIKSKSTKGIKFLSWEKAKQHAMERNINLTKITRQPSDPDEGIYVVTRGYNPGIYYSKNRAREQTKKYPGGESYRFVYMCNVIRYITDLNRPDLFKDIPKDERECVGALQTCKKFYVAPLTGVCYTKQGAAFIAMKNFISQDQIKVFQSRFEAEMYAKERAWDISRQVCTQTPVINETGMRRTSEGNAEAYVDGSWSEHTKNIYGSGIVFNDENNTKYFSLKGDNPVMSKLGANGGEIMAVWQAILIAMNQNISDLVIYTDSKTVLLCTEKERKIKKEGMRQFQDFFSHASEQMKIRLVKIKSHSGNQIHDKADILAKEALYQ